MGEKIHELKCWPALFTPLVEGVKTCDLRFDDRDYQVNDILILHEWYPDIQEYSGRVAWARVLHILKDESFGLKPGWAALSVEVFKISL